jgi:ATP-binding cassette subfamily B protein
MTYRALRDSQARLRTLWQLLIAPWPVALGWFVLLALAGGAAPFVQIWATTRLIDGLAARLARGPASGGSLWPALAPRLPLIAAFVGAWIAGFIVSMNIVQPYVATYHAEWIIERWSRRVLEKALRLRLEQFERPAYFDLLQRARAALDVESIAAQHSQLQRILARAGGCVGIVWALARVSWPLAAALVAGSLAVTGWRLRRSRAMVATRRAQTPLQRRRDYWRDLLIQRGSAAEIRLFGLQQHLLDAWGRAYQALRADRMRLVGEQTSLLVLRTVLAGLVYGLAIAGVVALIAIGRISLGAFAGYLAAIDRFADAIYGLLWSVAATNDDLRYIGDMLDYLDLTEETGGTRRLQPAGPAAPAIQFDSVSFGYPGADYPVLDAISFSLRPGERIALVGANGAGKTTLAKLLLGLYRPTAGRILVDGVDLADLDQDWWRSQCVAVFQDYVRYTVTARENIGFGALARLADEPAIRAAAQRSGADAIVAGLPNGYATFLGKTFDEDGCDLAAGQWQAFAIARAYVREARILVLDEPTAALDARAEVAIYRQFRDVAQGRSALLISHRLGSARLADRILVLAGGRMVEAGTHAELLAVGGHYAALYRAQAGWYQ